MNSGLTRRTFLIGAATLGASRTYANPSRIDRVMVQCLPSVPSSNYKARFILPALDALGGVRLVRCRAPQRGKPELETLEALAGEGVRFCFTLRVREPSTICADLLDFIHKHPGAAWAIEFPNEPDINPVKFHGAYDITFGARYGYAPALINFCQQVSRALDAYPALAAIPRIGFNDWMAAEQKDLVTYGNSHVYPKEPKSSRDWLVKWRKQLAIGSKQQGVITEWGRSTGGDENNVIAPPLTLQKQAELLADDLEIILAEQSVVAVSIFELFAWPTDKEMDNFGLFNSDLSARPCVRSIRDVLT